MCQYLEGEAIPTATLLLATLQTGCQCLSGPVRMTLDHIHVTLLLEVRDVAAGLYFLMTKPKYVTCIEFSLWNVEYIPHSSVSRGNILAVQFLI
jgi:hypothetical protein